MFGKVADKSFEAADMFGKVVDKPGKAAEKWSGAEELGVVRLKKGHLKEEERRRYLLGKPEKWRRQIK